MKRKIIKLSGVGLVLILMASLLISAIPVSAGTLTWTTQAIPDQLGITNQVLAGTDASFVKVAPNGDVFAVDTQAGAAALVYKSVTGGQTWTASAPLLLPGAVAIVNVVDLAISPSYTTDGTVFVLTNTAAGPIAPQVLISTNYGMTFNQLGDLAVAAAEAGTCLAVSPAYNAGGEVMVGIANRTGATLVATPTAVYMWGRAGVLTWTAQGALVEDVVAVAFSPNYQIDATVLAVSSTAARTALHERVGNNAWDATIGAIPGAIVLADGAAAPILDWAPAGAIGLDMIAATIAMPTDFNGSIAALRTAYVAIRSLSTVDRVYRVVVGDSLGVATTAMTPTAILADAEFTSLAFDGNNATGVLYAGTASSTAGGAGQTAQVYKATGPGTIFPIWSATTAAPIGLAPAANAQLTYVALDPTVANRVYAGTVGTDSGVSVSNDGGAIFAQAGLIDTILSAILDFAAGTSTDLFLLTANAGAGLLDSVWKSDDGGATWYRKLAVALVGGAGDVGILRVSPNYATDSTIYLGDIGSLAAGNVRFSIDGGTLWENRAALAVTLSDIAVKSQYAIYVSSSVGGVVDSTTNGGWQWQPVATPSGAVNISDIEIDLTSGAILLGTTAGTVWLSLDNNVTYIPLGLASGVANRTIVAFDTNYATNGVIYAANTAVTAGVYRWTFGVSTAWARIDTTVGAVSVTPVDMISAPDGTLYVSDGDAAGADVLSTVGGILRTLNPTAPAVPTISPLWERVAFGDGLIAGDVLGTLDMVEGSNILWATDVNVLNFVRTFTDTLSTATAAATTPAEGSVVDNTQTTVTFAWEAIPGAWFYNVRYDTRADFLSAAAAIASAPIFNPSAAAINALGFPLRILGLPVNGQTVYWQVRVSMPLWGPWSATNSFQTELVAAAVNSPAIRGPAEGGTNYGGWDASINPTFQWGSIAGATGYEFKLATDAAMTDLIVDATGANALGIVLAYTLTPSVYTLEYNTPYYWTVRAIGTGTNNTWADVVAFTTVGSAGSGEVIPPTTSPPVVITQVPAPTITIPAAPQATQITFQPPATEEISPAYIWVIIVIGAVLVIAVIVLIVRTRRSV